MANTKTAGSKTGKPSAASETAKSSNSTKQGATNGSKNDGTKSGAAYASKNGGSKTGTPKSGTASRSGQGQGNTQLEKYFHDALKDIYWAEKHLTKALPKMHKAATTDELKSAIQDHIAQTQEHISRVEQVFEMIGKKAQAKKCEAMEGLVKEGESIMEETEDGSMTRDVGIIMAAQKVEHYEIATYGGLVTLAKTMGLEEAASILNQTLEEEKQTDAGLSEIAENNINWEAEQEGKEDTDDSDSSEEEVEDEDEEA
ncbi:MAG: ferritin-like domain-containing protein [Chitinophagaceae bacterium]|nr:MAG: ferritin-like domain-containing protein [Chitinophagaceae bacterium]